MVLTDCSQGFSFPSFYPNVAVGTQCQGPSWGLGDSRALGARDGSFLSFGCHPPCWGPVPSTLPFVWMTSSRRGCHLLLTPNLKQGLLFSPAEPCFPPLSFFTTCAYLLCVY